MTFLPSHPDRTVPDPLSICEDDWELAEVPKWKFVSTLLSRHRPQPLKNWEQLVDILSTLQPCLNSCATLRLVLASGERSIDRFLKRTLPKMVSLALRMPDLFASGEIPVLREGIEAKVSLSREQIACLLVHMFLCSIQPAKWNKFHVNFHVWYDSSSKPVFAYLQSLITYFEQLDESGLPPLSQEEVTFHRCVLKTPLIWKECDAKLSRIVPSSSLEPLSNVEVDFANKDIGFGVSGSQEEAKLAQSPETCVVVLLVPTLRENEALVVCGARKVAKFEGVGRDVTLTGIHPEDSELWQSRTIIAIDALELDEEASTEDCPVAELREDVLNRELGKAFCGFSSAAALVKRNTPSANRTQPEQIAISTGHWGCGAFGGHKHAKALIQVRSTMLHATVYRLQSAIIIML